MKKLLFLLGITSISASCAMEKQLEKIDFYTDKMKTIEAKIAEVSSTPIFSGNNQSLIYVAKECKNPDEYSAYNKLQLGNPCFIQDIGRKITQLEVDNVTTKEDICYTCVDLTSIMGVIAMQVDERIKDYHIDQETKIETQKLNSQLTEAQKKLEKSTEKEQKLKEIENSSTIPETPKKTSFWQRLHPVTTFGLGLLAGCLITVAYNCWSK